MLHWMLFPPPPPVPRDKAGAEAWRKAYGDGSDYAIRENRAIRMRLVIGTVQVVSLFAWLVCLLVWRYVTLCGD